MSIEERWARADRIRTLSSSRYGWSTGRMGEKIEGKGLGWGLG